MVTSIEGNTIIVGLVCRGSHASPLRDASICTIVAGKRVVRRGSSRHDRDVGRVTHPSGIGLGWIGASVPVHGLVLIGWMHLRRQNGLPCCVEVALVSCRLTHLCNMATENTSPTSEWCSSIAGPRCHRCACRRNSTPTRCARACGWVIMVHAGRHAPVSGKR